MIRVASVPAGHPYVAHLDPLDETTQPGVVRLPDPPVTAEDGSRRWWPPRMLEPAWLREHADEFDVLHVHFGFESFTPEHLREAVATAHALDKAVVVTVHDLRNPHVRDPQTQLNRLDVLVPAADAVITLTQGAAEVIRARWGRDAIVVPHPHIVPLDVMTARQQRSDGDTDQPRQRIGLHLKSLRANVDAVGALDALALVASQDPDLDIVVTMHRAVADPSDRGYDARVVERAESLAARGAISLVLHEPMDDATLFAHVGALDVTVMANVWGTHSGWIEMCHDLGVRVVAPNIGFYGEQHEPVLYDLADAAGTKSAVDGAEHDARRGGGDGDDDGEAIDARRLADAIIDAVALGRPAPAGVSERRTERDDGARRHAEIYRSIIAPGSAPSH